jgi:hypothetical protein
MPISRLALSGLLRSGKDYIADLRGYKKLSLIAPLYKLSEFFFGTSNRDHADIRRFWQQVGQIGWGCHDLEACPYSIERALLVDWVRRNGARATGMPWYHWDRFGSRKDFWIAGCLGGPDMMLPRIAITNVRFDHELEPLEQSGFLHYLVLCSEKTREQRYGGPIPDKINQDVSEQYARQLATTLPDLRIIWNDSEPMPEGHKYYTLEKFAEIAK